MNRTSRATLGIALALALSACGIIGGSSAPAPVGPNPILYAAALDTLNFLPVTRADPAAGVITTGFATPPGGRTSYAATIQITGPVLDARTLRVSLRTPSGPATFDAQRGVEDAILARARQIRIAQTQP
ncbi:protein of unknown function [Loktanella fryxellensis]|uniref:DUF3576 domain-containing protein n=2 Tax=Loktanella fryxellensis TaxID=245187 RepID=A0A1H8HUP0_9RHOB|nr:DUF3576 domain-containing protein [Loktanella fryxellensis]SEN59892.1 protein of unknown function [Loktanella fryxellensis]